MTSLHWVTRERCEVCQLGEVCEFCGSTGYVDVRAEPRVDVPGSVGESVTAYVQTLGVKMGRDAATGYEPAPVSIPEAIMAQELNRLGVTFEQEYQVGPFFADFYFPSTRIVVEVDGAEYHKDAERDAARTEYMLAHGVSRVVRFRALEVFKDARELLTGREWLWEA